MMNPAAFVAVFSCFSASRNQAIGFTFAALGFGQLTMPLVVKIIVENLSYRLTIGIVCVFALVGVLGGKKKMFFFLIENFHFEILKRTC